MAAVFELQDVTFAHSAASAPVLQGLSMTVEEGRRTAVLGANGAGKTTMFYTLTGVNKPQKGTVLYRGEPLEYTKDGLRSLRSDVAVVLQNPDEQIFCSLVEEDVAFGPLNLGLDRDEVEKRVRKALDDVRLFGLDRRPLQQLSGGQRKRVAIAGALAMEPRTMIMDEPTAGLDPQAALEVMELAEKLVLRGVTVLVSTHDLDLAYRWADEALVLRGGKAVHSGDPDGFYSDAEKVYSCGLMPPWAFSMNREASARRGMDEAPRPRSSCELLAKFGGSRKDGRILLVPSGTEDAPGRLDAALKDMKDAAVGIYGSESRQGLSGREVDFAFDGLDSCLSRAVEGGDAVLVYDRIYGPLVQERLRRLASFGAEPEAEEMI